ncbi:nucleoside hydrolase [Thermodesulfobacteriota bacterium]
MYWISRIRSAYILLAVILIWPPSFSAFANPPAKVIFDTDISSDVDDVGAVAVLHALARKGKVNILAMMVSSGDPWSGPCLDALNTWFGRPDIPIGVIGEPAVTHESKYTKEIASVYPNDLKIRENAPDSVDLYRQVLASQPDNSVIIITVGYLTNLKNLLNSGPDSVSPLTGTDLVRKKVKQLVCMGGQYPEGREWNFYQDSRATSDVVKNWPRPIIFIGYESGLSVTTGSGLKRIAGSNPISRSYELYNNMSDRPSWDQLAVLFGATQTDPEAGSNETFKILRGVNNVVHDGSNQWGYQDDGRDGYLVLLASETKLKVLVEDLMIEAVEHVLSFR